MADMPGTHRFDPNRLAELTIDCDDCRHQGTEVCADCVVTYLCDREADDAVVIDVAEIRAVRLLSAAGLVPGLRHARTG
jgi:hypothetical protein